MTTILQSIERASSQGNAFWRYHESYQAELDALVASGAVVYIYWARIGSNHCVAGYYTPEGLSMAADLVLTDLGRISGRYHREGYTDDRHGAFAAGLELIGQLMALSA